MKKDHIFSKSHKYNWELLKSKKVQEVFGDYLQAQSYLY